MKLIVVSQFCSGSRIGLAASLILGHFALSQDLSQTTVTSRSASGTWDAVDQFRQQRQALVQQWEDLIAQGATPQQIQAWSQQNAVQSLAPGASTAQIEALRQEELQTFQQQNAARLVQSRQPARALSNSAASPPNPQPDQNQ